MLQCTLNWWCHFFLLFKFSKEHLAIRRRFLGEGRAEESVMPVLIMWAVPAVIFIGGVSYFLVRAVH
jgi:hypothetical protein